MDHEAQHHPGLDTLRAVAVLAVILRHARELLKGDFFGPTLTPIFNAGWVGVDLFFVLSGFLIGSQLFRALRRDGRVDFRRFYLKRSFRILPSFYAVLLVYLLWPAFREKPELDPAWRFLSFTMNYGRKGEAFSHAWSLCIEEHFYLVFPLIVAACMRFAALRRPVNWIAGALVGVVTLRGYLWSIDAPFFPAVYRPSHTHLDGLTVGVALALVREYRAALWERLVSRPQLLCVVGSVLVLAAMVLFESPQRLISYTLTFTFVSVGFGALVAAAVAPGFWLARARIPGAATIASLAFALYLTHKQMIHITKTVVGDYMTSPVTTVALAVVLIALAGWLLHAAVERPFMKLRDKVAHAPMARIRSQ